VTKYIFDASAVVNLAKRGRFAAFLEGETLDLARYEALNAVWKETALLRRLDYSEALELADVLNTLFRALKVNSIAGGERGVLELAANEGLTIYDASYLYLAVKRNLTLVTDDKGLRNKASRHVKVLSVRELLEEDF